MPARTPRAALTLGLLLAVFALPVSAQEPPPVDTVDFVDLERYDGLWYELARTPLFFEFGCVCTTATYRIENGPGLGIYNACNNFTPQGSLRALRGAGEIADPETNAKLRIGFAGIPPVADYWILDLVADPADPDGPYRFAAVGGPDREFVFILGRVPRLETEEDLLAVLGILDGLEEQLFDLSEITLSPQPAECDYDDRVPPGAW